MTGPRTPTAGQMPDMATPRAGCPEDYAGPVRMCVICRERAPKASLTRYVRDAQGNLQIDETQTHPGRGWYLCSNPGCAKKFAKFRPGARRKGESNAGK